MTNEWFSDRLWVFKLTGTAKSGRLLEIFAYARRRYGIDLFVIDNLAKCGLDEEDYGGQKEFIDTRATSKTSITAMSFVTHARKTNEAAPTGKMDVKGTGALTDMPDNVMAVWRNIPRELAQRKADRMGYESLDKDEQTAIQMPASMIRLLKQREGEGGLVTSAQPLTPGHTSFWRAIKARITIWLASNKANSILSGKLIMQRGIKMDRLIREMSYLFTKQRFMELQERAHEIAMSNSEHLECFGFINDAIDEFLEGLPDNLFTMKSPYALHGDAQSGLVG
jgi:hypothetical protein